MNYTRLKILIITFLIGINFSCQQNTELPSNVLSKETIVEIIVEMELIQAAYKIKSPKGKFDISRTYKSIYLRNGTSEQGFEESLRYFSNKPQEMEEIFNSVISEISRKQAGIEGK